MSRGKKNSAARSDKGNNKPKKVNLGVRILNTNLKKNLQQLGNEKPANQKSNNIIAEKQLLKKIQAKPKKQKFNFQFEEKHKMKVLWAGVIFFMALIMIIWIFNIKNIFKASPDNTSGDNQLKWSEVRDELGKTLEQMKMGVADIKQLQKIAFETATSSQELTDENKINQLKMHILENALIIEQATSRATTTITEVLPKNK